MMVTVKYGCRANLNGSNAGTGKQSRAVLHRRPGFPAGSLGNNFDIPTLES
jgi:hypothetical protein